jgi:hypothetical protein
VAGEDAKALEKKLASGGKVKSGRAELVLPINHEVGGKCGEHVGVVARRASCQ